MEYRLNEVLNLLEMGLVLNNLIQNLDIQLQE